MNLLLRSQSSMAISSPGGSPLTTQGFFSSFYQRAKGGLQLLTQGLTHPPTLASIEASHKSAEAVLNDADVTAQEARKAIEDYRSFRDQNTGSRMGRKSI